MLKLARQVQRTTHVARLHSSALAMQSSCKAGTVLNLKVRKSGDEPVALADSEYPDWLWNCLDKEKMNESLKEENFMKWRRKQINKSNTAKIKNNNFMSTIN